MADLVSAVLTDAKVLLNDPTGAMYTDAILLPFTRIAYGDIQVELQKIGAGQILEESATITQAAATSAVTLPTDYVFPIDLKERGVGETDWNPTSYRRLLSDTPTNLPQSILEWTFREGAIYVNTRTEDREVKLFYLKALVVLSAVGDTIPLIGAKPYLAYRTAQLACLIGNQKNIYKDLRDESERHMYSFVGIAIKEMQAHPTRKRPFGDYRAR